MKTSAFILFILILLGSFDASSQDSIVQLLESEIVEPFPAPEPEIICWCDSDAQFPGGYDAMQEWFDYNGYYLFGGIQSNFEGKVYVEFVVEIDGSITNIVIDKGASHYLDYSAIRLIQSMPKWEPATFEEERISTLVRIPINFELI